MVDPTPRSAAAVRRTTATALRLGAGLALTAGLTLPLPALAQKGGGVSITHLGHSALLIQGGGARVLVNPFRAVGCAAGLPEPRVSADVILASSLLKDEGAQVGSGKFLVKPGSYRLAGLQIEGIAVPHDRVGGRRFGNATLWRWRQGGLDIAHLGGTAGRLSPADRVLLGRPDVLIIGVGGGGKVYTGEEAAEVARELQARRVIPVQYTTGKPPAGCDQGSVQPFLEAMAGTPVQRTGSRINLPGSLSEGPVIKVMR